jgi:hypothetical protein
MIFSKYRMYKGYALSKKMTTNGIHKDWETLPPLINPDVFKEDVKIHVMKPKMTRCCNHTLITDDEYKQMENDIKNCTFDPTSMEEFDEWETAREAQELCDRRREERLNQKVKHM